MENLLNKITQKYCFKSCERRYEQSGAGRGRVQWSSKVLLWCRRFEGFVGECDLVCRVVVCLANAKEQAVVVK